MKNIYFVQAGFEFDGSVYLPYAVGTIIAYCKTDPEITAEYNFADIIFKREKLADAMNKIKEPYMVAFSCSVWNIEYNKALAKSVKEKYPECLIAFGGHSVDENGELIESEPYIDILTFGEGEKTFAQLLNNLSAGKIENTDNISYRKDGEIFKTGRSCSNSLEDLPSPYLSGTFKEIMENNRDVEFLSVLETNRGCPYSCAYCDWCAGKKMRFFPLEKVKAEIDWLSENKIAYCFCADSNFGMFDRDIEIAEYLISAKKRTGYPEVFRPCYEKNSDERVFRICSALNSVGMDKGATMAYQTLCDEALVNIGRKNLTMEHFSSLMKKYNEAGIPTYSELILGLPGETRESFCDGLCKLLENGQHNSVSVYHCEVLPNSDLSRAEYIEKHKIETIKVAFNHIHSAPKKDEEVKEYSYIVRSTATLNREDWVYANLFSVCLQCFHSLGILRFFALHLHTVGKVSYFDFYTALLNYILESDGKLNALWSDFKTKYEHSLSGNWNYYDEKFGDVTWFFEEGAFIEIVTNLNEYIDELTDFLKGYNIDGELFSQLLRYQKLLLRMPFEESVTETFDYNFHEYFDNIMKCRDATLERRRETVTITPKTIYTDVQSFAKETVWFGRRRGATIYGGDEVSVE